MSTERKSRVENRQLRKQAYQRNVAYFLSYYSQMDIIPISAEIQIPKNPFTELAYFNARLLARGYQSMHPHDWGTFIDAYPDGRLKRKHEMQWLKESGFIELVN